MLNFREKGIANPLSCVSENLTRETFNERGAVDWSRMKNENTEELSVSRASKINA